MCSCSLWWEGDTNKDAGQRLGEHEVRPFSVPAGAFLNDPGVYPPAAKRAG